MKISTIQQNKNRKLKSDKVSLTDNIYGLAGVINMYSNMKNYEYLLFNKIKTGS